MWLVRPELSLGLTDRIALQIQTDFGRERGQPNRVRDLSLQFVVAQAEGAPFGLAAEAGVDPSRGELLGEVFLFGGHEADGWRADVNLGLEQEGRETRLVYAWRLQRALGPWWAGAVEGGGGGEFGGEREHFLGANLQHRAAQAGP